MMQVAKRD